MSNFNSKNELLKQDHYIYQTALVAFHEGWATSREYVINCCKKHKRYNTHNECTWEYTT